MINFWWIRHAPVIDNDDCCYGSNEVACDTSDNLRFKRLVGKLPDNGIVFTSPLSRTIKTFEASRKNGFKLKSHFIDARIIEQNLGDWTGMKYLRLSNLTKRLSIFNKNWLFAENFRPPNGESFEDLYERVRLFINDLIKNSSEENIIIFSHGGPIRAAILLASNMSGRKNLSHHVDNLSLTKIQYNNGWKVLSINS